MNKKKILSSANDVINLEIKALQNLKKSLNNSFCEAVIKVEGFIYVEHFEPSPNYLYVSLY